MKSTSQYRLAAVSERMAVLAHEGRGELNSLRMGAQLLTLMLDGQAEALNVVERILESELALARLFEDALAHSAPLVLGRQVCDLRSVWREAWAGLARRPEARGAELEEQIETTDLVSFADAMRLRQVFRNLLENALAACQGPARITIRCSDVEVDGREALEIAVQDNGPGLSEEQLARLFEPFYTTKERGTGMGLTIVQRIMEAHGGTVRARNRGPGAEIVLVLPRRSPQASSSPGIGYPNEAASEGASLQGAGPRLPR